MRQSKSIKITRIWSCFILVLSFASCNQMQSMSSSYEISQTKPDGPSLTRPVIILADNHFNHLYGDPTWLRSEFTDKLATAAIRPVQLDLFGQDVLRWVLRYYGVQYPVIHLGDAVNLACTGELEAFFSIMNTAKKQWLMLPGNHDGYFFGDVHGLKNEWTAACARAGTPLSKDVFVEMYLSSLQSRYQQFGSRYSGKLPLTGEWLSNSKDPSELLLSVAWTIDHEKPWHSFVIQEIDLTLPNSSPMVSAVLLDTAQYGTAPQLLTSSSAGANGDLQSDQLGIVERWFKSEPEANKIVILMGHHPFDSLTSESQKAINTFRHNYRVPLYVSAHTHTGQYFARGGDEGWLELNVGSIIDWPMEFRSFSMHAIRDNPQKLLIYTKQYRIDDLWTKVPTLAPACDALKWEAKKEDKDFYLSYADRSSSDPAKTQLELMDTLLSAYIRLIENVSSAADNNTWPDCCHSDQEILGKISGLLANQSLIDKVSFLMELRQSDENRKPKDLTKSRDYRLCQALWASKYDKIQGRRPESYDSYIIFPQR